MHYCNSLCTLFYMIILLVSRLRYFHPILALYSSQMPGFSSLKCLIFPVSRGLTVRSCALSAPLRSRSSCTNRPPCVHKDFALHALTAFVQCSLIIQSDNIIFRLITIQTCSLLLLFPDYQRKLPPRALRINRLSCVHIEYIYRSTFTLRLRLRSAFAHSSPFISAIQIRLSVHSPRSFRVHSPGKEID